MGDPRRQSSPRPPTSALTAVCAQLALHPGLGWLNVLVLLTFWNAMKFAWVAALTPFIAVRHAVVRRAEKELVATN